MLDVIQPETNDVNASIALPEVPPGSGPASTVDFTEIYAWAWPLMVGTAVSRFGVPESDAETLAQDIYLDFLVRGAGIEDKRGWFIGAIFNASRAYRRKESRYQELPPDFLERPDPALLRVLDMWPDQLAGREAFARTTAKCQLALYLRFFEGYTVPEIAVELGTTKRYAAKLIVECLKQAERRYTRPKRGQKAGHA